MSRVVLGLAIVPMLGLLGGLAYWKTSVRAVPPAADSARGELASLRAELASLKANSAAALLLAQQSAQLAQHKGEKPAAPAPTAQGEDTAPSPPAEATEAPLTQAEVAVYLDNTFDAEPVDPAWGKAATQEATRALSSGIPSGTKVKGVQCRTSLCRVETSHTSVDDFRAFATGSLLGRDRHIWNGGVSTQVREESATGVTAVTYIAKEGQSVPVPERD